MVTYYEILRSPEALACNSRFLLNAEVQMIKPPGQNRNETYLFNGFGTIQQPGPKISKKCFPGTLYREVIWGAEYEYRVRFVPQPHFCGFAVGLLQEIG